MNSHRRGTAAPRKSSPNSEAVESAQASRGERLQKVLAAAGFGSRRHCEELILAGRVTVDKKIVTELGTKVDPATEKIFVDAVPIRLERKRYFLLCKPTGVVCTAYDPAGRTKAIDLLPKDFGRLFTVGRLDENSEGLLLVTNDGELANRLAHPRFQVERRYRVLVAGQPTAKTLADLKQGFFFTEGKFRVQDVRRISTKGQSAILEVTLTEGQNREIRRLFARVGHKVMALMRVGFGPLELGDLKPGEFRELSHHEVMSLQDFVMGKRDRKSVASRSQVGGVGRSAPSKAKRKTGKAVNHERHERARKKGF